ncbi:BRO family protein [Microbulbifer sp. Q7]|uniref:BRO-N domain-containing protein n=1 Tax=Microbulbifer sp. Q7 TaxID=1785091 RepID=UPI00082A6E3F|nr:BRO family protein [Microbulbifer sp. Q7]
MNELTINDLTSFQFDGQPIKVVQYEGLEYWVVKEVCDLLGHSNPRQALKDHVDSEDILTVSKRDAQIVSGSPKARSVNLINEAGLYGLIFGSRLEAAQRFKRWVFKEVLPSIRKHGGYTQGQEELTELQKAALHGTAQSLASAVRYLDRETKHLHWLKPDKEARYLERVLENTAARYKLPMALVVALNRYGLKDVQKELAI